MSALDTRYNTEQTALMAAVERRATDGPDWVQALRQRGMRIHAEHGIPTPRTEAWKYTPLRSVAERTWQAGEAGPAVFDFDLPQYTEGAVRIVLVNGRFDRNLSDVPRLPGLTAMSLRDAWTEHPDLVREHLGQIARIEEHTMAALATALFQDGLFLHIKSQAVIESVIEIVHVTSGQDEVFAPRLLIVAEDGAIARIVETYITDGDTTAMTLPVSEVVIGSRANIEHVRVQDEATSNIHLALWETRQAGNSEYRSYNVAFGAAIGRTDQGIDLQGEWCTTRLDGVVVGLGEQILDNHTRLDHALPNCNSFEIYKQVIGDRATVVFNGQIYVHPHAQKTDAKQTNQAILLSPTATINSKPQLEIFADDVKCTHGATVGQLEDLPLFYMRQRGVPKALAQSLLVYAFAAEVLELISMEEVRLRLEQRLFERLNPTNA